MLNYSLRRAGLREVPIIKEPNTCPIPVAAPPRAIVAIPAAISLAAYTIKYKKWFGENLI